MEKAKNGEAAKTNQLDVKLAEPSNETPIVKSNEASNVTPNVTVKSTTVTYHSGITYN